MPLNTLYLVFASLKQEHGTYPSKDLFLLRQKVIFMLQWFEYEYGRGATSFELGKLLGWRFSPVHTLRSLQKNGYLWCDKGKYKTTKMCRARIQAYCDEINARIADLPNRITRGIAERDAKLLEKKINDAKSL